MSLLLDALNRASKEKHKAAAAALPEAAPVAPLQWDALPVAVPEEPALQTRQEPQMAPSAPPGPPVPAGSAGPETWELSLAPEVAPQPPAPPPESPTLVEPAQRPAPLSVVPTEPVVQREPALVMATALAPAPVPTSTLTPGHSPAAAAATPLRPAAVEPTMQDAKTHQAPIPQASARGSAVPPVATNQVAQEILRASAIPATRASGRRRLWMLGGLAAGLALVLGVVFSGLVGDPGQLLGFGAPSTLVTPPVAAPVPDQADAAAAQPGAAESLASSAAVAVASGPQPGSAQSAPAPLATPPTKPSAVVTPVVSAQTVKPAGSVTTVRQPSGAPSAMPRRAAVPQPAPQTVGAPVAELALRAGGAPKAEPASITRGVGTLEQGYAALLAGRFDEAAQAYRQALRANPQERDALLGLAYVSQQQGQRAEAQAYYREVLRQEPNNAIATAGLQSLDARPESTALSPFAGALVEGPPDSAAAMAATGSALVRDGRLGDAAQAFARAQTLEPNNPLHAYNHAVAQDRMGRHEVALRLYENVLKLDAVAPAAMRTYQVEGVRVRAAQLRAALGGTPPETP